VAPRRDKATGLLRSLAPDGTPDAPALVLVHPGALTVAHYRALAEEVSATHRFRVVDLEQVAEYFEAALAGGRATISIEEIAERVTAVLRENRLTEGQWLLAGWSFGGVVAHAVTSLLTESELPAGLVVLDSIAPVPAYTQDDENLDAAMVLRWFAMYLAAKRGGPVSVSEADLVGHDIESGLSLILDAGLESGILLPGTALPGLRKVFRAYSDGLLRNNRLAMAHRPMWARVPVTLVRPERGLLATPDPLGWEELAADLTTRDCPGDHYSMLTDPAAVVQIAQLLTPTAIKS
jgi:thioesterase domain-containing protein